MATVTMEVGSLGLEPGHLPPAMDPNGFGFLQQAGDGHSRRFAYYTRKDLLTEIVVPGYFNRAREYGLAVWDIIEVTYGSDPRTAKEVRLRVVECERGFNGRVTVGKVGPVRQCTPVEHGVETEDGADFDDAA